MRYTVRHVILAEEVHLMFGTILAMEIILSTATAPPRLPLEFGVAWLNALAAVLVGGAFLWLFWNFAACPSGVRTSGCRPFPLHRPTIVLLPGGRASKEIRDDFGRFARCLIKAACK